MKNNYLLTFVTCLIVGVINLGTGFSMGLPPMEMQYPIRELSASKSDHPARLAPISLAGARNEQLFCAVRMTEADPFTLKISVAAKDTATPSGSWNFQFFQLCWAPAETRGQWQPDALLPVGLGLINTGAPVIIVTTLRIPVNLPQGVYSFDLLFNSNDRTYRQPLAIRVFNFALPDDLPIAIMGNFWHYGDQGWFAPFVKAASGGYPQLLREYYRNMRSHKITALGNPYPFPFARLTPETRIESFQEYQQMVTYTLKDLRFHYISIPQLQSWKTIGQPEDNFTNRAHLFYPLYQPYLNRNDWSDRAVNYLLDEPRRADSSKAYQAFKLSKALAPSIKTLSAGWNPDPRLEGVIDIWAMQAANFREAEMMAAQREGQKRWLYINRLHGIDQPLVHQRLIGCLLYRYRFSGYLLWGVNFWPKNPWATSPGESDYWRRGTFYYPHPKTGQPVATYRLLSLVRGFEDYQYLILLEKAYRQGQVPAKFYNEITLKIQRLTCNIATNRFDIPMEELETIRLAIGEMLDGLKS